MFQIIFWLIALIVFGTHASLGAILFCLILNMVIMGIIEKRKNPHMRWW